MTTAAQKHKAELQALAEGLPVNDIELPEYRTKRYEPESIRQDRHFSKPEAGMQAVARFLMERGTVEILTPENTLKLFTELHWCAFTIRKMARKRFNTTRDWRQAVERARQLVSRMEATEEELFIANRRQVVSCVKPFFWIGQVWLSDFLQEGSRALSNAIRKFDFTRGTPFYAYAQIAIKNRLRNFFRDHVRSGSLGIRPSESMMRLKQIMDKWREEHGELPPVKILAHMTGFEEEKVKKLLPYIAQWEKMPSPPISLDATVGETTSSLHELIEDKDAVSAAGEAEKSEVWSIIEHLPERSKRILHLRFIEGRTLEETGTALGLTRARIKQIQDESLHKLRKMLQSGVGKQGE